MTLKIALVGSAPSSAGLAPYHSSEWQIWGCSPGLYGVAPRTDAWFEIHRYEPGQPWFSPEYQQFLANYPGPVYMARQEPSIPHCIVPDKEALVAKYGPYFFTSSLAWMFAMAMEAGATSIGLWGVDMAADEEYGLQRPALHYFAQIAQARGIEVGVPPESDLLVPPALYGFCEYDHHHIKLLARQRELEDRLRAVQAERHNKETEEHFVLGALSDLRYQQNTWLNGADKTHTAPAGAQELERQPSDKSKTVTRLGDYNHLPEMVPPGGAIWVDDEGHPMTAAGEAAFIERLKTARDKLDAAPYPDPEFEADGVDKHPYPAMTTPPSTVTLDEMNKALFNVDDAGRNMTATEVKEKTEEYFRRSRNDGLNLETGGLTKEELQANHDALTDTSVLGPTVRVKGNGKDHVSEP